MKYKNIVKGTFLNRPNRFIAEVLINGKTEICHVKNTGRCKEILKEGAIVLLEKSDNPLRKTQYDLVSAYKEGKLINIDSQAPNKVFREWLSSGKFFKNIILIKPEAKFNNSRFDFYFEKKGKKYFAEIKGVTLENEGVLSFPDAPTARGVKHVLELCEARKQGFETYIFFIVQMKEVKYFTPNVKNHKEFAEALLFAESQDVKIYCLNCEVTENSLDVLDFVPVRLTLEDKDEK